MSENMGRRIVAVPPSVTVRRMFSLIHLLVLTATVLFLSRALPGFRIKSASTSIVVALLFSVVNVVVSWVFHVLIIIPAILTLGLAFLLLPFLINTAALWLTDKFLDSFEIDNTSTLLLASGGITIVNALFHVGHATNGFSHALVF